MPGQPTISVDCVDLSPNNFQSKVLFKTKGSEAAGETTAVQIGKHPSQEKFFEFLGKRKLRPPFVLFVPSDAVTE